MHVLEQPLEIQLFCVKSDDRISDQSRVRAEPLHVHRYSDINRNLVML